MGKVYVVTVRWIQTPQNAEMIDAVLGQYGDWIRWNGWTWFIQTAHLPSTIRAAVLQRFTNQDSLLIAEINKSGLEGWAPQWVWDWFNSRMNPQAGIPPPSLSDLFGDKK